jgi:gliding motility-associated protein GldM
MAGGKLSPRQKMINMMYLVLTALLALNVSKEILDSFVTVNTGLENTKQTLREKMDGTYQQFSSLNQENPQKYGANYARAAQVQEKANELVNYIDTLKVMVIKETEKIPLDSIIVKDAQGRASIVNLGKIQKKDAYNEMTNMMVGSEPAKPREGPFTAVELRTKMEEFRDLVKSIRPEDQNLQESMDLLFNFEKRRNASGTMENWESLNFYHVPLAAGITIMSKMQSDVRNAENEIVNVLLGDVESKSFKFNTLIPIVKPQSSYVTVGSTFRADIFLGAYDNQNAPEVYIAGPGARVDTAAKKIIGEAIRLPMDGAMARLEQGASGAGLKTVSGIIKFKPVGGEEQIQVFETTYEVAAPNLVVSPTKMNVFYRGIENPVDVSVSGYSSKDIQPSINNGQIRPAAGGGFVVTPGQGNEAVIGVTVTNPDGTKKSMEGLKFRVKNVPDPVANFGGKGPGDATIQRGELNAALGVSARMENFEFDLKFDVIEFTVVATIGGEVKEEVVKGNRITETAKAMFGKVKSGQRIWIENVKAKGPDGSIRKLGTLALKVN